MGAIEPNTKLILDELAKIHTDIKLQDAKWESRVSALEIVTPTGAPGSFDVKDEVDSAVAVHLGEFEKLASAFLESYEASTTERLDQLEASSSTRVAALESATTAFELWHPLIESSVGEVKSSVTTMQAFVDLCRGKMSHLHKFIESGMRDLINAKPSVLGDPVSASARPSVGVQADSPFGHRVDSSPREPGCGHVFVQTQLPTTNPPKSFCLFGSPHDTADVVCARRLCRAYVRRDGRKERHQTSKLRILFLSNLLPPRVNLIFRFPFSNLPQPHARADSNLLASQVGGDVTFKVSDEVITAHKYVLAAQSSVFRAQLFGLPGKEDTTVQVADMGPEAFRALLHFIYTSKLPEVVDDGNKIKLVQDLLVAATRYGIKALRVICEDILYQYIDESTAATTLRFAEKHGCRRLMKACVTLLKDLLASVQGSAGETSFLPCSTQKRQRS
ncbi:hypothetical protein PR202_ga22528 [Eleusine coracana subsp. coracana]|uniref:BTB domain-containing protein n=1 Tax=Eleusine coracana subsp. coracana TaxID=191504 RepID=A0AAV5D4B1_ELECO|nr:hypothetical protein PR202_ga22528 [Eleusine coracana subsp. coracana]